MATGGRSLSVPHTPREPGRRTGRVTSFHDAVVASGRLPAAERSSRLPRRSRPSGLSIPPAGNPPPTPVPIPNPWPEPAPAPPPAPEAPPVGYRVESEARVRPESIPENPPESDGSAEDRRKFRCELEGDI